jgi:hypothetical protein
VRPGEQRRLRQAWFGTKSVSALSREFGFAEITIRKFWQRERDAGRLPAEGPRPHFAHHCARATPAALNDDNAVEGWPIDNEIEKSMQSDDGLGARIPDDDPLLAALRRVHGNDPRRLTDTVPVKELSLAVAAMAASKLERAARARPTP